MLSSCPPSLHLFGSTTTCGHSFPALAVQQIPTWSLFSYSRIPNFSLIAEKNVYAVDFNDPLVHSLLLAASHQK